MIDAKQLLGTHDVLMITLDTLRYDVAVESLEKGATPNLADLLPGGTWEKRHSPGNFTYAAHQAFFAGFLPTPEGPGPHERLFAVSFDGSETISDKTCVFDAPDIISGFSESGYHTACIGGVGFFNKRNRLGCVLPNMFEESHWSESLGVTDAQSTRHQVDLAMKVVERLERQRRLFLFINVSALHQPNCIFMDGATEDSPATQAAALAYVDRQLPRLLDTLQRRAPVLCIFCSDHGTAYGEDGLYGHRLSHPVVWTVPYAEFILPQHKGPTS